jgi:hypothetical protein
MTKKLKWGETPWDKMSHPEMLREIQRMYSALEDLYSVVNMTKYGNEDSPYYSSHGVGGNALEKGRQILEPLREKYDDGMFRSFFRYADDLLFEQTPGFTMIGSRWHVCPVCGWMVAENPNGEKITGKRCGDVLFKKDCDGILSPITWDNLARAKSK